MNREELSNTFSNNLIGYLHRNRMDCQELAEAIGVTAQTVKVWISMRCLPRIETVFLLSDYTGINPYTWMAGSV